MPRIRTFKPDFWGHPRQPSPWARLLFLAMLNWADDAGIGTANPKELAAFAFPNDEEIDSVRATVLLREIYHSYQVVFYVVGGRPYYAVENWQQHQKINNPAKNFYNPQPDKAETWLYQDECQPSCSPTVGLHEDSGTSGVQEVGSRKSEVGTTSGYVGGERYESNARAREPMDLTTIITGKPPEPPKPPPPDYGPNYARAMDLVATIVGRQHPEKTRRELVRYARELLDEGIPHDVVEKALRLWMTKKLHPSQLPMLVSDVIKESTGQLGGADGKAKDWDELGRQRTKHNEMALAQQERKELE